MKGNEESFQLISSELAKSIRAWETGKIKPMQHAEKVDGLFSGYGWSKTEFFKELDIRIGKQSNDRPVIQPVKKKRVAKVKVKASLPALIEIEKALIRNGATLNAIKAYRKRTEVGLKDAKDACSNYIDGLNF
jgi:hypothetical protein